MTKKEKYFSPREDYRKITYRIYKTMKFEQPKITKIIDFYEDDSYVYLIQEYIPENFLRIIRIF